MNRNTLFKRSFLQIFVTLGIFATVALRLVATLRADDAYLVKVELRGYALPEQAQGNYYLKQKVTATELTYLCRAMGATFGLNDGILYIKRNVDGKPMILKALLGRLMRKSLQSQSIELHEGDVLSFEEPW